MKYILGMILLALSLTASAAMLEIDGTPRPMPYTIAELTAQCDVKGYFLYGDTIYSCVKIREGVTKEQLRAHAEKEHKRLKERYAEILRMRQDAEKHK